MAADFTYLSLASSFINTALSTNVRVFIPVPTGSTLAENTLTFTIQSDNDLEKVELIVNGILLDQIGINDFASLSFELSTELIPIDSLRLIACDRFFNETQIRLEISSIQIPEIPATTLDQNYPNPFKNSCHIDFALQHPEHVRLFISDLQGRLVETLINEELPAGNHQIYWAGHVPLGTYLYTLETKGHKITKRLIKN